MGSLSEKWKEGNGTGLSQRILGKIKPDVPVKNKVDFAQKKLQFQVAKLSEIHAKLQEKHDYVFNKIVEAQKNNNTSYARAYATELHEIRKMKGMVNSSKIAMEQIQIRLNTVCSLGDVVVTLSPCMSILRGLTGLGSLMPEANASLVDLSKTLSGILSGSSVTPHQFATADTGNAESIAILEEAQSIIEGQTRQSIPEPPSALAKEVHEETSI